MSEPKLINEVCIDDLMVSSFCDLCNGEFIVSPETVFVPGNCFCSDACREQWAEYQLRGYPKIGEETFRFWAGLFRKKKMTQTIKEIPAQQTTIFGGHK